MALPLTNWLRKAVTIKLWWSEIPTSKTLEFLKNTFLFVKIRSKGYYEQRLLQCWYNEKLNYTEENNKMKKKSRKRNILWFNPPYSKSVKTNIGKLFLCLINKHFLPTHKYRKILNRNTFKISYSCMPNIKSKISTHKKRSNKPINQNPWKCNWIIKNTCSLNGNCLLKNIQFIATIKSDK